MNQLLSIVDDGLVIKKLSVQTLDGPVQTNDDLRVQGNIFVDRDIKARHNIEVAGTLTVDTIKVKNLLKESSSNEGDNPNIDFTFIGKGEKELEGQGLVWLDGESGSRQFVYKPGNKLWSTMSIDLARDRTYQIDKLTVLSSTELGSSVVKSNLRKVGELENLRVSGQMVVDGWAFFNSYVNRFGLNTENPNGTLGVVVDNNVEVIIGSKEADVATIGTFSSNRLDIVTDNKTRMSVYDTGEVVIGNSKFKNGVVKIHGRLEVDELVTGAGQDPDSSLVFKNNINGKGVLWNSGDRLKQLIYLSNPDRLFSSEVIDLYNGKWFSIDGNLIVSKTTLGSSVTESSLEKVGVLRELEVAGPCKFHNLNTGNITASRSFALTVDGEDEISVTNNLIRIGLDGNINGQIQMNGQTSFKGSISINNKRIITGNAAPASGRWSRGDICYNDAPEMEGYVGWVCVQSGDPGRWCPFGLIMPVR